ncbi:glutathione S-transferase T3-like [Salvia miltiorrhiza]|uniref:glutathione S-transferase T3-like n=1 Tax=Salvia miltiorrhiza TaxID=226208 RepID=UPI0025ABEDEE|nr:glutathione S-transferase T3-like [Salvia miltiorrhiza]
MDPRNFFENPQNFSNSQDYYPNLDNIDSQVFGSGSNPQFPYDLTHENSTQENVHPTNTNTSSGPQGWNDQEDLALMYAWCTCSSDSIVGTNQNKANLWKRIRAMYEESRLDNSRLMGEKRSIESLRNRYKRLNANVTKWVGAYVEAYARKSSGMSDADVEKEAQIFYGTTKFTHHEIFEKVMRHHPNWELKLGSERTRARAIDDEDDVEEDRGSSKKSRTTEEDENPNNSTSETPVSETSTICRPAGRDKAKAKRKGKAKMSQQSIISEDFTAELQALRIVREKETDAINRMGEIRMQSTLMMSKWNVLNTLLGKSNLSPQEESMKNRLMAELFP